MKNTYMQDLKFGTFKENVVLNILKIEYDTDGIIDNTTNYHDIKLNNGLHIEVKSDRNIIRTGQLWIEYCGNTRKQKPGWLIYSDADILAYNIIDSKQNDRIIKVLFINFNGLRKYIEEKYFMGDFNNPITESANIKENGNTKALLIGIEEVRPFILSVFSTVEKKKTYVPDGCSLDDIIAFLDDLLMSQSINNCTA